MGEIFKDRSGAPRRSLYKGVGFSDQDLRFRPHIGLANSAADLSPAHAHLKELSSWVKAGIWQAGGIPLEFGTFATCGNMAVGTENFKYELVIRDIMAASVEIVTRIHSFDGLVLLSSCDSLIPGQLMAAARLNIPSLLVSGGPMETGYYQEKKITNLEVNSAVFDPSISVAEVEAMEDCACPGVGACPVLGTANTMQIITEALGMSLSGSSTVPAVHQQKRMFAQMAGSQIVELVKQKLTPKKILTSKALRNGIATFMALGGSLNAVLHLISIAQELGLDLPLAIFDEISRKVPCLTAVNPNGPFTCGDFHQAGGAPALLQEIKTKLSLETLTVNGVSLGTVIANSKNNNPQVIRSLQDPVTPRGSLAVLTGSLAPEGAIIRQSALSTDLTVFSGPARVFSSDKAAFQALQAHKVQEGEVLIIKNEGPRGAPGMREVYLAAEALCKLSYEDKVVLITDGRFSGFNRGPIIGHVAPEAALGGPIALVQDGDEILIDLPQRKLDLLISPLEMAQRQKAWQPEPLELTGGILDLYQELAESAEKGAALRKKTF